MNDLKTFLKDVPRGLWLMVFLVFIIILALPILFTRSWFLDFSETGQIGDTIGGIMGPFIAIVAAFLTFIAFWAQYVANNELINENRRNHFENRFYKMLDIHLENVANMNDRIGVNEMVSTYSCFQLWCEEIMKIYTMLVGHEDMFSLVDRIKQQFQEEDGFVAFINHIQESQEAYQKILFDIAYGYFYNGEFVTLQYDDEHQTQYVIKFASLVTSVMALDGTLKQRCKAKNELVGRYYRHLFQIVKFVDSQPDSLYDNCQWKRDCLGLLRSQMSDYEQLLLYYNAQSTFGKAWDENHYIETYRLIRNIPFFSIGASAGISPSHRYHLAIRDAEKRGESFFERW